MSTAKPPKGVFVEHVAQPRLMWFVGGVMWCAFTFGHACAIGTALFLVAPLCVARRRWLTAWRVRWLAEGVAVVRSEEK